MIIILAANLRLPADQEKSILSIKKLLNLYSNQILGLDTNNDWAAFDNEPKPFLL